MSLKALTTSLSTFGNSQIRCRAFVHIDQWRGSPRRSFHATPRPRFIDTCLSETHTIITTLHTVTGLPWAATIPLTALLIRVLLIAPITTYAHSVSQRRQKHFPVLNAWRYVYQNKLMENERTEKKGPQESVRLLREMMMKKSNELYARTGTQRWKSFLPYLQFPVWLTAIETIRRMSGAQEGLVGLLQKSVTWSELEDPLFDSKTTQSSLPPSEQAIQSDGLQTSSWQDDNNSSAIPEGPVIPIEPSFATEGMLWFPDLLVPDPHLYLPFVLSLTLFANINHVERTAKKSGTELTTFRRRLGNAFKIVALAVGPMTLSMPSAIHLYWISSSIFALGHNMFMNWYSPLMTAIRPCKLRRMWSVQDRQKAQKIGGERD